MLFGWYGFNSGGTIAAADIAAIVFTNTGVAAAVGMIVWIIVYSLHAKKASFLEAIVGAVAGLATITPASGYVTPISAVIIGAIGAFICFFCVEFERKMWDDALDVWGVHGMGGFGFCFSHSMMNLLQTPTDILEEAVQYLRIYFAGFPFPL